MLSAALVRGQVYIPRYWVRGRSPVMRVAIIGAGLQARRRAPAVARAGDEVVAVCAAHEDTAKKLAAQFGCQHDTDWRRTVSRNDVDVVVICTLPGSFGGMENAYVGVHSGYAILTTKEQVSLGFQYGTVSSNQFILNITSYLSHHPLVYNSEFALLYLT